MVQIDSVIIVKIPNHPCHNAANVRGFELVWFQIALTTLVITTPKFLECLNNRILETF